jgi:hypothetical protein
MRNQAKPPNPAPAPNRRPRFALVTLAQFVHSFRVPPASPAAVGEAHRWPEPKVVYVILSSTE